MTLPRGPEETTQSWYASARLGVYICTVVLWTSTCRPRVLFFCSRVKEKGASYSCSIFKALSDKYIDWSRAHSLVVWSDGGKHFRCNATISTITLRGLEALVAKSELGGLNTVDICFGVPNHFKNRCDGAQAYCRAVLEEARKAEKISDIGEMIKQSRRIHAEHRADPSKENVLERMPCEWIDFFPDQGKKEFRRSYMFEFHQSTFLQPIQVCQAWQGRLNDVRRKAMVLYSNPKKWSQQ